MMRPYDNDESDDVLLFVGTEIEKTPAYGMKTLFVVGAFTNTDPLISFAHLNRCNHIYLGANHSFHVDLPHGTNEQINAWEGMIYDLLDKGFWVTLDYDVQYHSWVSELCINEYKFIPMVSVKLPYIDQMSYNACLKIDDRDFNSTNPGVWVHTIHNLKDRSQYTKWSEYGNDTVICREQTSTTSETNEKFGSPLEKKGFINTLRRWTINRLRPVEPTT